MLLGNGLRFDANLTWLFTELPFEQRFDEAAAAGFTAVEYAAPYPYSPAVLTRLLADAGLTQILINTPADEHFRAGVERGLEYAVAIGSSFLHVVAGIKPGDVSLDRALADYVANVAWAAEQARGTGVRLLVEAQNKRDKPGFLLENQARAAAVVDAVDEDHVGLLLDVYHSAITEEDLMWTLREYLPRAFHVQIADPPGRIEPGNSEVPWRAVFDTLRSGYDGWIGCEYRPAGETVEGLTWITELAR
jgi:hydroxypyruvate isomerase